MRILMIHGRAQGGHLADDLQSTWTKTLQEGFGAASKSWPTALDVDFPYYADPSIDWRPRPISPRRRMSSQRAQAKIWR